MPLPPLARLPTLRVHALPALLSGTHDQPAVLAAALKDVPAGTTSPSTTPVAPWLPPFA